LLEYSDEIKIEDPDEFLKKTEPFVAVARNMISGNKYLKYVFQRIEDAARRYAAENIKKRGDLVPKHV
jgi:hypothetical protein